MHGAMVTGLRMLLHQLSWLARLSRVGDLRSREFASGTAASAPAGFPGGGSACQIVTGIKNLGYPFVS